MSFVAPVLMGVSAASGVMQMFGSISAGNQAAEASNANAANYQQQAENIRRSAAITKANQERQKATAISTQKANFAGRGVKISGSPLLVMADTAANLELDIQTNEYNTLVGASQAESAAAQERYKARLEKIQGYTGASGALLNTGVAMSNFFPAKTKTKTETY